MMIKRMHCIVLIVFTILTSFGLSSDVAGDAPSKYYELTAKETVQYARSIKTRKAIFIYASWCPHCRNALPKLMEIEKSMPGSVMPVSVDDDPEALYTYLKKYPELPFHIIVLKGQKSIEQYLRLPRRSGVPHYILMDESGKVIRSANMRTSDVEAFVKDQRRDY